MFSDYTTWQKIDYIEDFLFYTDAGNQVKQACASCLHKLYLLAWLEDTQGRESELMLMRLSAALAWVMIPTYVRRLILINVD